LSIIKNKDYDVIIIGAGIGGLVCGCYIAQRGLKVLIVEKNVKPGGYCRSFSVNGFHFDTCAHSLGGVRQDGNIGRIISELELKNKIQIERSNPSNIVITPHFKIHFWNELDRIIQEFQSCFPDEAKKIEDFFNFVYKIKGTSFSSLIKITFEELLEKYFKDKRLKAILSLPLLGNIGLPASRVSAFTAVTLYQEFLIDGGYHPVGGMGRLSDVLSQRFKELKGDIVFGNPVEKISFVKNSIKGVHVKGNNFYTTEYIVSDIDARQTFINLIQDKGFFDQRFLRKLDKFKPSLSTFVLYLGLDSDFSALPTGTQTVWYLSSYNVEKMYRSAIKNEIDKLDWFLFRIDKDRKSIMALVNVPFINKEFWQKNKKNFTNSFIKKIENLMPGLSDHIIYKSAATPATLLNWSNGFKGASYGWESTLSQVSQVGFSQATPVKNLYLCGHWATIAFGIPGVAYLGRSTANIIIKRKGL